MVLYKPQFAYANGTVVFAEGLSMFRLHAIAADGRTSEQFWPHC